MTPVATLMRLAPSVTPDFRRAQIHTKSAQVHKAGKDYDPGIHAIDYIAMIELRELTSDTERANVAQNEELTRRPSANQ